MPGFSTEEKSQHSHVNIHMLTRDFSFIHCWTDYCHSTEAKICCFKRRFLPVFENSRGSIVCLHAANPVMCHDWAVLFLRTSPFQCDSQQMYVKTKPPNQSASRDLLHVGRQWNLWNFRKPAKNRRLKWHIFCFCGVTVVSSTVFEREISCQHVRVNNNMRMLRFFFWLQWRNLALFSGGVTQFLIGTFTPVSSLCMILYYHRPMDSPSD